jgi:hypothetical protein
MKETKDTREKKRVLTAPPEKLSEGGESDGLVAVNEMVIDGPCLDWRDRIRDVIDHLDEHAVAFTGEMALKPRGQVLPYLIVVIDNLYPDGVMGTSCDHELKKGIARVSDIVRCFQVGGFPVDELVKGADVIATPAMIEVHLLKNLIFGRRSGLIGSDELLLPI